MTAIAMTQPRLPTVLVVEDEVLIRMMAADVLEAAGHRMIEAGTADAALSLIEADEDIGVLFTDIDMPGSMDGLALARLVKARWPGIAIVVTSGHVHPGADASTLAEQFRFMPKPYDPDRVADAVRALAA